MMSRKLAKLPGLVFLQCSVWSISRLSSSIVQCTLTLDLAGLSAKDAVTIGAKLRKRVHMCVQLTAGQRLGAGPAPSTIAVASAGHRPRALCMKTHIWIHTIIVSHNQVSNCLCLLVVHGGTAGFVDSHCSAPSSNVCSVNAALVLMLCC